MNLTRLSVLLAAISGILLALPTPAAASITLGQLAPDTTSLSSCNNGWDWVQPTVISGNSYVVPELGAITSWSTTAPTGPGQNLAFKIFRRVTSAPGNTYAVTAQDGPHPLTLGSVNTFAVNLPVQPGDVIGLSTPTGNGVRCQFTVGGETYLSRSPPLAVGQQGDFGAFVPCCRNNETAVLDPQNSFTLGGLARNKKKGTAMRLRRSLTPAASRCRATGSNRPVPRRPRRRPVSPPPGPYS